ncbi:hypothetical protein QEH59_09455 [Coraliomargarita sp. SDUM461004]|uniref:Uncharacterized protein n=1 Tax=Thalassobacterium sedimentorum TaxID=3041258 RepID=A0ABU1AIK6_9BACT|nr:hypothetical protein [Coraliomargarita sp. SDUM461004]MDQ8194652.1 hypothetical protein [Coraliomargarita sp. SDUM461004]
MKTLSLLTCILAISQQALIAAQLPESSSRMTVLTGVDVAQNVKADLIKDPTAISGYYASPALDYKPFATANIPEEGEEFNVWVHYRQAALQMKTMIHNKWIQDDWNWNKHPNSFSWRKVGTFQRDELGNRIIFITPTQHSPQRRYRRCGCHC